MHHQQQFSDRRNLKKGQLGGVIFGCKNSTLRECLTKQIFGLPAQHFSYVKNIDPGLPLFLFNDCERKLHGIFEAASCGQMIINPYGWTANGSEKTQYPAQVQVRVRQHCQPLHEDQFKPIIVNNYYVHNLFWFELDHAQTSKLMSLFASLPAAPIAFTPENTEKWIFKPQTLPSLDPGKELIIQLPLEVEHHIDQPIEKSDFPDIAFSMDEVNSPRKDQLDPNIAEQIEKELILKKLQELALIHGPHEGALKFSEEHSISVNGMHTEVKYFADEQVDQQEESLSTSSDLQSIVTQLVHEVKELRAFTREQSQKIHSLEQKLVEAENQIQHLKDHCKVPECISNPSTTCPNGAMVRFFDDSHTDPSEAIYLLAGFNGESCLSDFCLYFPSQDVLKALKPMSSARSYASVARLHDEIYIFGGGNGQLWYDTVEAYNFADDQWTFRPALTDKKGSLAGVTLGDKIFALGGGNGIDCFSQVEMLDLDVGRWIPTRSMLKKRFALAAVELNGVIYATGGYDGNDYLQSVERFDPREHSWTRVASMNTRRGCHSLVVLNEKLYAMGGYDGNTIVQSTEIYDPRLGTWMNGESMKKPRGYSAAAVVKGSIYVIGGVKPGENTVGDIADNVVDTVEHFKEDWGWQEFNTKCVRGRSFMSAIAL